MKTDLIQTAIKDNGMKKVIAILLMALATGISSMTLTAAGKTDIYNPDGTYKFAERDTCDLFLDVYNPTGPGVDALGNRKPTIIFVFGGGFIAGQRNDPYYSKWFRAMNENGYRVVSIDYRLGLKGAGKVGIGQVNELEHAIDIAVEDLFSATVFLIDNAESLGIDPDNLVISGSSAGAITVLQADYELSNRTAICSVLPEGFRYAGVMSFAGAIFSRKGAIDYNGGASPTLLMHGTEDRLVPYGQIRFFNLGFFGSDKIAGRLHKYGCSYNILRFTGHGHEVSGSMYETVDYQRAFIEENIMKGIPRIIDATITDPAIPSGEGMSQSRQDLYGK